MLKLERRSCIALIAGACLGLVAGAPAMAAGGGYYDGKNVTLIVPNTPAGAMSQYARMIAPYIAKYSGAKDVRVDNQPGAGGLRGTNLLWRAKPDGLTIAFTSVSSLLMAQLAESPGAQFDAAKFTYLGRAVTEPRILMVGANSSLKTIDDVKKLNRPFIFPTQGTDEDFYAMSVLFSALGVPLKIVTGYDGDADTSLAVIKGDGDGHMASYSSGITAISNGEKRVILTMSDKPSAELPAVPAALQVVTDPKSAEPLRAIIEIQTAHRGFFGPPDMDPAATEAMRKAISQALADPDLIAEAKKHQFTLSPSDGATEQARIARIMASSASLKPILKSALQSIK